jgi:hypothetical protein
MNKIVVGLLVGSVAGALDGLSALVSAPQVSNEIVGIVIGSSIKGVITGVVMGLVARKLRSLPLGILTGGALGFLLALPIAILNRYYWQILLPGMSVGILVGFATQRYGAAPRAKTP